MYDHQGIPFIPTGLARTMETNLSLTESINVSTTDPSHLFWVPASHHPEIAPAEFEKHVQVFRTNVMDDDKVKRRRSALSFSFTAVEGDVYQDSDIPQTTTGKLGHTGDNYHSDSCFSDDSKTTINDIDEPQHISDTKYRQQQHQQAFSSLVRSTSLHSLTENDDSGQQSKGTSPANSTEPIENDNKDHHTNLEAKARKGRIRRSMSLQLPDSSLDPGKIPDFLVFDRHSTILDQSPVLVSKTNRPLSRRGARTKFRKTSTIPLSSLKSPDVPSLPKQWSTESLPDSSSTTTDIDNLDKFDNNANDTATTVETQQHKHLNLQHNEDPEKDVGVTSNIATVTSIQHSTTNDQNFNVSTEILDSPTAQPPSSPSPSLNPTTIPEITDTTPRPLSALPVVLQQSSVTASPRERKSTWSWSFWTDGDKKAKNDKMTISSPTMTTTTLQQPDQENTDIDKKGSENIPPPSAATESPSTSSGKQRFGFSSLFSRKASSPAPYVNAKSEKEKPANSTALAAVKAPPKDFQLNKMNHQRRLPIHTERAMYRLSHMKLANSRRPLRDQVIISNFMFWYLSIINNQQQQQQHQPLVTFPQQDNVNNSNNANGTSPPPPRQNLPRTPQQIITASRNKKRQAKKNHHSTTSQQQQQQQQQQHGGKPTSSYQKKRSSSLTPSTSSSPQSRDKTGQHYIDKTSNNQTSTGFVVPENYLRPAISHSAGNKSKPPQQQQRPGYARSSSWSSDDDDDDDEDDLDESDDDSDDDDGGRHSKKEGGHGKGNTYSARNEHTSLHQATQKNHRPPSNQHPYNQHQQQQPEQHTQHYLISASAT